MLTDRTLPAAPLRINERDKPGATSLGKFKLKTGTGVTITLSNNDTDGHVVADGVQILKVP